MCTMCAPMYPHGSSDTCGGVAPCTVLKYGDCCMYSMSLGSSVCVQKAHWAPAVCTVLMLCATYGDNSAPEPSLMSFLFHSD